MEKNKVVSENMTFQKLRDNNPKAKKKQNTYFGGKVEGTSVPTFLEILIHP